MQNDKYENDEDRRHYENSSELMLQAIKFKHNIENKTPWKNYKNDFSKAFRKIDSQSE